MNFVCTYVLYVIYRDNGDCYFGLSHLTYDDTTELDFGNVQYWYYWWYVAAIGGGWNR